MAAMQDNAGCKIHGNLATHLLLIAIIFLSSAHCASLNNQQPHLVYSPLSSVSNAGRQVDRPRPLGARDKVSQSCRQQVCNVVAHVWCA